MLAEGVTERVIWSEAAFGRDIVYISKVMCLPAPPDRTRSPAIDSGGSGSARAITAPSLRKASQNYAHTISPIPVNRIYRPSHLATIDHGTQPLLSS